MKKTIIYSLSMLLCFLTQTSEAQLLYSEDFDNYSAGSIGTNINGTVPGKGGWYTYHTGSNPNIADFQLVPEPGRGNVLKLPSLSTQVASNHCVVFRNDLLSHWQKRNTGNNILKLSFDFYTGDAGTSIGGANSDNTRIDLINSEGDQIIGYMFVANTKAQFLLVSFPIGRNNALTTPYLFNTNNFHFLMPNPQRLPTDQWITLELYIDYTANMLYFGIPSLNYTIVRNSNIQLDLGKEGHDDSPAMLIFSHRSYALTKDYFPMFDNINLSAQSTRPTVSVENFISQKLNLFPNPVTEIVTISNNENIGVKQIEVFDISGKTIKSQEFNNENEVQLNLANVASGMYLLHIKTNEGTAMKKVMKK